MGFRYFLVDRAKSLKLQGWVRNRADGSVELMAEGDHETLERLLQAARQGPRSARIDAVEVEWQPASGDLGRFDLIY